MAEGPSRLGRGLAALLGEVGPSVHGAVGLVSIPVASVRPNPDQPRRRIDPAALEALTQSVRASGLVQPIVVRPVEGGAYELIAGERRWRAAAAAGLREIPAVVRPADERERLELGLIENMVRQDLNPLEIARSCAILLDDFGQTQAALGERLGRSRPAISNLLRLLELPDSVQALVASGDLSEGHARAVLMADGAGARRRLAEQVVAEGLSVRETERLARGGRPASGGRTRGADLDDHAAVDATDAFYAAFGAPVRVRRQAGGSLVVEIRFPSEDALHAAISRLPGAGGSLSG